MTTKYEYEERVIVKLNNGKKASYSRKRYGILLDEIVKQSMELDKKIFNPFKVVDSHMEILYWDNKNKEVKSFIVNKDIDIEFQDKYWATNSNGYVHTTTQTKGKPLYLHWFVTGFTRDMRENEKLIVDHINHNILDNREENLRIVTFRENNTNQKNQLEIGVSRDGNGWRARWSVNGTDFSKSFFGEGAFEKAKEHRYKMIKETGYLVTFNDYSERK